MDGRTNYTQGIFYLLLCLSIIAVGAVLKITAEVVLPVVTASKLEELWTRVFWIGSQYVIDVIFAALLSRKGFKAVGERERWLRSNFHY